MAANSQTADDRDWPVEFRYVKRFVPICEGSDIGTYHPILQVRYRDDNTGSYYTAKDNRYTHWQDIPIVEGA